MKQISYRTNIANLQLEKNKRKETEKKRLVNQKRNHKSNREKSKLSVNKLQDFPENQTKKKISKTYITVLTTFITLNKKTRNLSSFFSEVYSLIGNLDFR